jgi:hypothetical protein
LFIATRTVVYENAKAITASSTPGTISFYVGEPARGYNAASRSRSSRGADDQPSAEGQPNLSSEQPQWVEAV